jgi:hypothetical protein
LIALGVVVSIAASTVGRWLASEKIKREGQQAHLLALRDRPETGAPDLSSLAAGSGV